MLSSKNGVAASAILITVLLLSFPKIKAQEPTSQPNKTEHTLVFMTDFGLLDDSVAICKAVMLRVDPTLRIMDITNDFTPFFFVNAHPFPPGTSPTHRP